jgi:hypothetical protein
MKKHLRTLAFGGALLVSANVGAQTPVGTLVGNFTLTDISGGTHDLYSYLDAGKMVVIDVSATWCGPCWSYHNTHALEDFETAHGPSGANDAVVLFVEGDPSTTTPCLYGPSTSGCTGGSQGDWVTGTNYPIIDLSTSASFTGSGLEIPYFPCMYVICPNRTVYKSGVAGSIGTLSLLNSYIGDCAVATSGTNAALNQYSGTLEAPCSAPATAKVILQNMGTTTLTSCTITGTVGSTTLGPINWTGSLDTYEYEEVNLGSFTISGPQTMNISITTSDASAADNVIAPFTVSDNSSPTTAIIVQMVTDAYGSETTWNVKNSGGTTVGSGGPYGDLSAAGTTTQPPVNLTLPAGCYTLTVNDSYGDGMNAGYGTGSYAIKYGTTTVLSGGVFTNTDVRKFSTSGSVGIDENSLLNSVSVYPNPVNAAATVNVELAEASDITLVVTNSVGQVVSTQVVNNAAAGSNQIGVDFQNMESGVYYINVKAGNNGTTVKVVK